MPIPALILLVVLTVLGWCLYGDVNFLVARYFTEDAASDFEKLGQWGDSFGAFTALFSALGTIGVVWTLAMQQKSMRAQAEDLHRQKFESTFFQLLALLKETRLEVKFKHSSDYLKKRYPSMSAAGLVDLASEVFGLAAFIRARTEVFWWIEQAGPIGALSAQQLGDIFKVKMFTKYPGRFGAYYRLLYSVLSRIGKDQVLTKEEKADYSRLLRAQLTIDEVQLAALNGLTSMSGTFDELLIEFKMLKYIKDTRANDMLGDAYPDLAYESRD